MPSLPQPKLLIATRNPGKMREYRQLLHALSFELVSLGDVGVSEEVEETGVSFAENATLKASTYAALSGLLTLADDSGLEVDALGGEPGIHSARYGEKSPLTALYKSGGQYISPELTEPKMSDQDRVELLLHNLEGVPWRRRTARFRCVIAIVTPPTPPSQGGAESSSPLCQGEAKARSAPRQETPPNLPSQTLASASPPFVKGGWGDLAPPDGTTENLTLVVGSVAGMIQYEPVGQEGFGYDPVFYLPSYRLTMAQLPLEEKNRISHRANAAGKAIRVLKRAFSS